MPDIGSIGGGFGGGDPRGIPGGEFEQPPPRRQGQGQPEGGLSKHYGEDKPPTRGIQADMSETTRRAHQTGQAAREAAPDPTAPILVRFTAEVEPRFISAARAAIAPHSHGAVRAEVRTDDLESLPAKLRRSAGDPVDGWHPLK
jgi:hypothetical protein